MFAVPAPRGHRESLRTVTRHHAYSCVCRIVPTESGQGRRMVPFRFKSRMRNGGQMQLTIRAYDFGSQLTAATSTLVHEAERHRWPLELVHRAGFPCVPGFVLSAVADPSATPIADVSTVLVEVESRLSGLAGRAGLRRCRSLLIDWKAYPHIDALPGCFDAFDLDAVINNDGELLDRAALLEACSFVERYDKMVLSALGSSTIDEPEGATTTSDARYWKLPSSVVRETIARRVSARGSTGGIAWPTSLVEQLHHLVTLITTQWLAVIRRSQPSETNPWLSLCVRDGVRRYPRGVAASGLIAGLGGRGKHLYGSWAENASLDDIDAGLVDLRPLGDLIRAQSQCLGPIVDLSSWVTNHAEIDAALAFVLIDGDVLVDGLSRRPPDFDTLSLAVSRCELRDTAHLAALLEALPLQQVAHQMTSRLTSSSRLSLRRLGSGIPAGPGVQVGRLALGLETIRSLKDAGEMVVFAGDSPEPEMIASVLAADAMVFARGGATSHVAVIARCASKACVLGVDGMRVQTESRVANFHDVTVSEGDWITVDGATGQVYAGRADVIDPVHASENMRVLLERCDDVASVRVYSNIDTADEAKSAVSLGARGIGLCRLEHLIPKSGGMQSLQRSIALGWLTRASSSELERARADVRKWPTSAGARESLADLERTVALSGPVGQLSGQVELLAGAIVAALGEVYDAAGHRPVVVRLLDPPLSEFINARVLDSISSDGFSIGDRASLASLLEDKEPSMGLRGVRVCLLIPELARAQVRGILRAARAASRQTVDILVPFVVDPMEVLSIRRLVEAEIRVLPSAPHVRIGAMVETPRAAALAGDLAQCADFLSIGTNDLTQFVWAASRDGAERGFLQSATEQGLSNPFIRFDENGVGALVKGAVDAARARNPQIEIGVCGEHAREPDLIKLCHQYAINYVSVAPRWVPVARVASAQAAACVRAYE